MQRSGTVVIARDLPAISDGCCNGPVNCDITEMYFSHWKTVVVSEKVWSVNLEASISGEYQTLGGYSGWPLE
jgi:hypothetical protein